MNLKTIQIGSAEKKCHYWCLWIRKSNI